MKQMFCTPAREGVQLRVEVVRKFGVVLLLVACTQLAFPQTAEANALKSFFSLFEKKKPKRAPTVVVPRPTFPQGKRIFNPFIGAGGRSVQQSMKPKPKTFNMGRRTMCVRLCDGYYWPMKRGGSNNSLMTDSQKCESQCSSAARLFVLRSSTDNIGQMRDLTGKPYSGLKNAFAYRKTYNPSCRCRAEPWSERAKLRHKRYAAVGKERRNLAIRSIRLDLRSTIKPGLDPAVVMSNSVAVSKRFWNPILPVRKPQLDVEQRTTSIRATGVVLETSYAATDMHGASGGLNRSPMPGSMATVSSIGLASNVIQSRVRPTAEGARVLNFGNLAPAQTILSRGAFSSMRRFVARRPRVRSSVLPSGLELRARLN